MHCSLHLHGASDLEVQGMQPSVQRHQRNHLGRDLDVQYKTSFVLCHKLREAVGDDQMKATLSGEVDGAYFGGHVRQKNEKADHKDRRLAKEQTGKRQSVVVARERWGRPLSFVVPYEER